MFRHLTWKRIQKLLGVFLGLTFTLVAGVALPVAGGTFALVGSDGVDAVASGAQTGHSLALVHVCHRGGGEKKRGLLTPAEQNPASHPLGLRQRSYLLLDCVHEQRLGAGSGASELFPERPPSERELGLGRVRSPPTFMVSHSPQCWGLGSWATSVKVICGRFGRCGRTGSLRPPSSGGIRIWTRSCGVG